MSKTPWIRFFPSDWLGGTRGMTAAETGIYVTLIMTMYEHGKPLVNDVGRLARLCGASNSVFKSTLNALISQGKILISDEGIWNERVGRELFYVSEKSSVGREAANARWYKKDNKNNDSADANALQTQSERNANQKPDTRYIKKDTIVSQKKGERLPDHFIPDLAFAQREGFTEQQSQKLFENFKDYWKSKTGKDATKLDWQATWRNWVRSPLNKKLKDNRYERNHNGNGRQLSTGEQVAQKISELGRRHDLSTPNRNHDDGVSDPFQGWNETNKQPTNEKHGNSGRLPQIALIASNG